MTEESTESATSDIAKTEDAPAPAAPTKDPFEKGIFGSKKFKLAVFTVTAGLVLAAWLAYVKADSWAIIAAIIMAGFVASGTIGGQAWQERYTRVAFFDSQKK